MTDDFVQRTGGAPRFRVLLATYDGERHLGEQLSTLAAQTIGTIDLLVSDDGSRDGTREILSRAQNGWTRGSFEIVEGPRAGFAENFRSLILRAGTDADFYAFCDQDDLWDSDKLAVAHAALAGVPDAVPALYCGATRTMAKDGRTDGTSPIMRKAPSFRNALVQSIAGGNTMVMNRAAFELLRRSCDDVGFVSHDWWSYLVVAGAGGTVIYDPVPHVSYRQHGGNQVGANTGMRARMRRLKMIAEGRWYEWQERNTSALAAKQHLLTAENRVLLAGLMAMRRDSNPLRRLSALHKLRLHRQNALGNASMALAILARKF